MKRQLGKTRLYTPNSENLIVRKLLELEGVLIGRALDNYNLVGVVA